MPLFVLALRYAWGKQNFLCVWINRQQLAIEQGMQVGPEKKAVWCLICVLAAMWNDMRGLKDIKNRAACNRALPFIG